MDPNKCNNGGTPGSVCGPSQAEGSNGPPPKRQALDPLADSTLDQQTHIQYSDDLCLEKRWELSKEKFNSTRIELHKTANYLKKLRTDYEIWGKRYTKDDEEMQIVIRGREVQRVEEKVKMVLPDFNLTEFLSKISDLGEKAQNDKGAEERLKRLTKVNKN